MDTVVCKIAKLKKKFPKSSEISKTKHWNHQTENYLAAKMAVMVTLMLLVQCLMARLDDRSREWFDLSL